MGGHAAGREAAELAVATIFEMFEQAPEGAAPAGVLRAAIEEASRRVHVMPTSEVALGRPGSTVVAVLMHAQGTEVAHVGDSRVYLVHEGQIFRVTRDHSIVQELVDRGLLTPQQAAHHPDANRITRALGMAPDVEAELRPQPVQHVAGDAFVLCSDGLSDLVEDAEILAIVGGDPAAQAVGKLVDLANARGGHDNITVIVLRARTTAIAPRGGVAPTVAQTRSPRRRRRSLRARARDATPREPARRARGRLGHGRAPGGEDARRVRSIERRSGTAPRAPLAAPVTPTRPPGPTRPGARRVAPTVIAGVGLGCSPWVPRRHPRRSLRRARRNPQAAERAVCRRAPRARRSRKPGSPPWSSCPPLPRRSCPSG